MAADTANHINHIPNTFPFNLLNNMSTYSASPHIPIFIIGLPRPGTMLTEQILCTDNDVESCGELDIIQRFIQHIEKQLNKNYPECLEYLDHSELISFLQLYLAHQKTLHPSTKYIIDKQSTNFIHLGLIQRLFPEAKIIHTIRGKEEYCLSCYFQNFKVGNEFCFDLNETILFYNEAMSLMKIWSEKLCNEVHNLKYENIVLDFDETNKTLFDHIGQCVVGRLSLLLQ